MQIPAKLPGLKMLTAVWAVYGVVWMALEGNLWRVVLMAGLTTAVLLATLGQKVLAGRLVPVGWWVVITAVTGLGFGLFSALLTLFFMALKTGLHGHGPEFSLLEIHWVLAQIPLWTAVGCLAGAGLGLVSAGLSRQS